jgi:phosphoglycolate phosphatase-like HAD superfamily hydrolase
MKLAVFDFDGTLAKTMGVDTECYVQAFGEALEIRGFSTTWTDYEHVTDEGVTRQIFVERFGRHPHAHETDKLIDHFIMLLTSRCEAERKEFAEVPGAASFVTHLRAGSEWGIALATGAWRRSVQFKMERAGIPIADIPSAFSEDGPSRESIVLTAIDRAASHYRQHRFERIVSVGDALWDVKTARKLGLPFLGIADEPRAAELRRDGASHVIEDYLDSVRCLQILDEVRTPISQRAETC